MRIPFPGMDPYLEDPRFWSEFHSGLINQLTRLLLQGLSDRYESRIGERRYRVEEATAGLGGEQREEFIEIRNRADGKLATLIDVVSPSNKRTDKGREAYLSTRKQAVAQKAGIVEIDLVLEGKPTLTYSRDGLPEFDYAVSVTKSIAPDRYEIYTSTLNKRLPKFKVPLASDDRDTLMDLQTAFTRVFELQGFASRIDYRREPVVPFNEEGQRYLSELRKSGRLPPLVEPPPREHIAVAAYYLWLQAGCPDGCDLEHWHRARRQLARS